MNWIVAKIVNSLRRKAGISSPSKEWSNICRKLALRMRIGIMQAELNLIKSKFSPYEYGKVYLTESYLDYPYSQMESLHDWYGYELRKD